MAKREGNFVTLNHVLNILDNNQIRYYLLQHRPGTVIDFDLSRNNHTNLNNILNLYKIISQLSSIDYQNFQFNSNEIKVLCLLHLWPIIIDQVHKKLDVHLILKYLQDLVNQINLSIEDINLDKTKFLLYKSHTIMSICFKILGFYLAN